MALLLDELSSEVSNAKIKAPTTHKPVLDPKKSVAIICSSAITISSSVASDSRFPALPVETDVKAIARSALINL